MTNMQTLVALREREWSERTCETSPVRFLSILFFIFSFFLLYSY